MLQIVHVVTSDNITRFAWYGGNLFIEFKKTREVYRYDDVPEALFDEMCQVNSVGGFFHAFIRRGGFVTTKLPVETARSLGFEEEFTVEAI